MVNEHRTLFNIFDHICIPNEPSQDRKNNGFLYLSVVWAWAVVF